MERNRRQKHKKRHELMVKKYYTEPCIPTRNKRIITTTTKTIRCTSCEKCHEDRNHFKKCVQNRKNKSICVCIYIYIYIIYIYIETRVGDTQERVHTREFV